MKEGPNIAFVASLIGDPARANMLTALLSGRALTATELANEAGITPQTASSHLAKLQAGELVRPHSQGRHRYFALADPEIAAVLEGLMTVASKRGLLRTRTGPKDAEMRRARVCYDHLAGEIAVRLFEGMRARQLIVPASEATTFQLSAAGRDAAFGFGIDVARLAQGRRPLCKGCLDWSARRLHLSGSLGAAVLARVLELGWAKHASGSRVVCFRKGGEEALFARLGLPMATPELA